MSVRFISRVSMFYDSRAEEGVCTIGTDVTESVMNIDVVEFGVWIPLTDSCSQVIRSSIKQS